MKVYIYQICFPTTNKSYIGQTNNLKKRTHNHLCSKYPVGNALRKYDDWQICILHTVKDKDTANLIEIEEIRNFNSIRPNGYNLTRGGEGVWGYKYTKEDKEKNRQSHLGKHHSDETKTKIGISNKIVLNRPEVKAKLRAANIGKRFTEEHKAKLSIAHKGKHLSKETKAKISIVMKGKKHGPMSKETKAKISITKLGKKRGSYKKKGKEKS